jgi:outer membrane protein assembly factor BamB
MIPRRALLVALVLCSIPVPTSAVRAADSNTALEPLWYVETPPDAESVVADAAGTVVVGAGSELLATDQIGGPMWRVRVDGRLLAAPALADSLVVVPLDTGVVAVERSSGSVRWRSATTDARAVGIDRSASIVAVADPRGIDAVDVTTGETRWRVDAPMPELLAAPARLWVTPSRVVSWWAETQTHLLAYERETGALVWKRVRRNWTSAPALIGEAIFVAENRRERKHPHDMESEVVRLDVETGSEVWGRRLRGIYLPTFGSAATEQTIAVIDLRGRVKVLDARTGRIRWMRATRARQLENEALLASNAVAFTTYGTGLIALDASDGRTLANEVPGRAQTWAIIYDAAVAGDQLYLLVHRTGVSNNADGELWMLPTSSAGLAPGYDLDPDDLDLPIRPDDR